MTDKTVNYAADVVAEMVAEYVACGITAEDEVDRLAVVEAWSQKLNKVPASIRAKLSSEGVYIAKVRKAKSGGPVVKKGDLVELIAHEIGVPSEELDSLSKATKDALKTVLAGCQIVNMADQEALEAEAEAESE